MKKKHLRRFGSLLSLVLLAACGGGAMNSAPSPGTGEGTAGLAASSGADQAHYENMADMLRGKVPGLEVIETDPGTIVVRIRGGVQSLQETMQEPLVVIDGMPQSRRAGEVLMALNPRDVASIDVLKDVSSTAIYGTRGANGVIIVRLIRGP